MTEELDSNLRLLVKR